MGYGLWVMGYGLWVMRAPHSKNRTELKEENSRQASANSQLSLLLNIYF